MDQALCAGRDPEIWFPGSTGNGARTAVARAAAICAGCPVQVECREYAEQVPATDGVWGGWSKTSKSGPVARTEHRKQVLA